MGSIFIAVIIFLVIIAVAVGCGVYIINKRKEDAALDAALSAAQTQNVNPPQNAVDNAMQAINLQNSTLSTGPPHYIVPVPGPYGKLSLAQGESIDSTQYLTNQNGDTVAVATVNGQLCTYPAAKGNISGASRWCSSNAPAPAGKYTLSMQTDGNVCVYPAGSSSPTWCSMTNGKGTAPYTLAMEPGGLYERDYAGDIIWNVR